MKQLLVLFALFILSSPAAIFASGKGIPPGETQGAPVVVSTAWLASHIDDPNLIVFHVGSSRRDYAKGHIPGARFLWSSSLSTTTEDLTLELPPEEQADSVLRNLGVSEGARIVLYFANGSVTQATRMFLTLEYLGLSGKVSLLDGGLDAWKAEGRSVTAGASKHAAGSYVPRLHPEVVVDAEWVAAHLNDNRVAIVDARGAQFYQGKGGGMPRAGHIPGAVNIQFSGLVDSTNRLRDKRELEKIFEGAGVKPGVTVVSYCHIGQQASLVYFVARYLGYDARLYDGSFEDWSSRDDLPVVNPSEERGKK
ncbi:MAG TPA: sulfurtransferase [Bacteroidota bacterium]|nr:sulfurtransferase [Bacteroidota bacterium]